ncbi:MAG: RidA family protein [Aestuariibacter sp.]
MKTLKCLMKTIALTVFATTMLSGCVLNHTSKQTPPSDIERHYLNDWEKQIGYAQVVRVGNTLHVSGVVGGGASLAEQLDNVYRAIGDILAKFNATPDDIVKEVLYTTDMDAMKKLINNRKGFYSDGLYPAATWVQIERLFMPEAMLEVDVTVVLSHN